MSLKLEEIRKIAKLARIKLSQSEEEAMNQDLNKIFSWVSELNEVNTNDVDPMYNVHDGICPIYEDKVSDGNKSSEVTANSPVPPIHNFFRVPKVVE